VASDTYLENKSDQIVVRLLSSKHLYLGSNQSHSSTAEGLLSRTSGEVTIIAQQAYLLARLSLCFLFSLLPITISVMAFTRRKHYSYQPDLPLTQGYHKRSSHRWYTWPKILTLLGGIALCLVALAKQVCLP
jgi:hypothetical protein